MENDRNRFPLSRYCEWKSVALNDGSETGRFESQNCLSVSPMNLKPSGGRAQRKNLFLVKILLILSGEKGQENFLSFFFPLEGLFLILFVCIHELKPQVGCRFCSIQIIVCQGLFKVTSSPCCFFFSLSPSQDVNYYIGF